MSLTDVQTIHHSSDDDDSELWDDDDDDEYGYDDESYSDNDEVDNNLQMSLNDWSSKAGPSLSAIRGLTVVNNVIAAGPSLSAIRGLTVVNNELFVVRKFQSQVNVYDSHSLMSSRDINIPDMKSPQGLAGCAHNKALYIGDVQLKCIHRVDLTNNSATRWTMREGYVPWGLSVTAEHNLLVTMQISGTPGESRLSRVVEYTSEGQQVREIRLDKSVKDACQTVQLSSSQFVCHGFRKDSLHRVCQINAEGQIIKSYGKQEGRGEGQLSDPQSLTIDNNSKHVFVADMYNHRILLFDFDLTYLDQVHTPRCLESPWCLYFDSSTDRLFVGDLSDRVIVIRSPTV